MRYRPTPRLPGMLIAALLIYVFATNSQVIWLYLVSSLVLGLVAIGLLGPWLTLRRAGATIIGYTRAGFTAPLREDRERVFGGDLLKLRITLGKDASPLELLDLRRPDGSVVPIRGQALADAVAVVEVAAQDRGVYRLGGVRVSSSWPLGIARAQRELKLDFEVLVHPRYVLPPEVRRPGQKEPTGASVTRGSGEEFLGLREYRTGDSQRRVHWPTSARTGKVMVVETARESSNSNVYLVDLGEDEGDAAELAVQVAASLAARNVAAGVPLTMNIVGQPRQVVRWSEVLDALARARPTPGPRPRGRRALRIGVEGGQVLVDSEAGVRVVDARLDLDSALATLDQA